MRMFLLSIAALICASMPATAGERGPGKYSGVVVFDRWDACVLYSGTYLMYVSQQIKDGLRPYAGQAVELDATQVYQPLNPGDGLIRKCSYVGPAPKGRRPWIQTEGLELQCSVAEGRRSDPVGTITIRNLGQNAVQIRRSELSPTLLVKREKITFTPSDDLSMALITRQSFEVGGEEARWHDKFWSMGLENALPKSTLLPPNEELTLKLTFNLPDGEYDFLAGYGGGVHEEFLIAAQPAGFNIRKGKVEQLRERPDPRIADQKKQKFEAWLGSQSPMTSSIIGYLPPKKIDLEKDYKLSRYTIDLAVTAGSDLQLEPSKNPIVIFDGEEFSRIKSMEPNAEAKYIVGRFCIKPDHRGWQFYSVNVRVTDGPLKGAIIHLRDGKIQDSIVDPCFAIYEVPKTLDVPTGPIPFEVIGHSSK